eukprot:239953-Pleurochrysis_carterae.AAC.5
MRPKGASVGEQWDRQIATQVLISHARAQALKHEGNACRRSCSHRVILATSNYYPTSDRPGA